MPDRIALLLLVAAPAHRQAQMRASLNGSRVRVEAAPRKGLDFR